MSIYCVENINRKKGSVKLSGVFCLNRETVSGTLGEGKKGQGGNTDKYIDVPFTVLKKLRSVYFVNQSHFRIALKTFSWKKKINYPF